MCRGRLEGQYIFQAALSTLTETQKGSNVVWTYTLGLAFPGGRAGTITARPGGGKALSVVGCSKGWDFLLPVE